MANTRNHILITKSASLLITGIIFISFLSCEPGAHGTTDPNRYLYLEHNQFLVLVTAIDSATSEQLSGVWVGEVRKEINFDQVFRGDTLIAPFTDHAYYLTADEAFDYPTALFYEENYPRIAAPTYSRFIAYKSGYHIWTWSAGRDTIRPRIGGEVCDSLCIHLVKR